MLEPELRIRTLRADVPGRLLTHRPDPDTDVDDQGKRRTPCGVFRLRIACRVRSGLVHRPRKFLRRDDRLDHRQQQERIDSFIGVYNNERPHQALGGAYPGELFTPSARIYEAPSEPDYPYHDRAVRVTRCGRICIGRRKINLTIVFAGQTVRVREVEDQIWLVSFLEYDLGYFDNERGRVEPGPIRGERSEPTDAAGEAATPPFHPFMPDKVLTM